MPAVLELPEKGKASQDDLSRAIEVLLGPAIKQRNIQQIGWWITDAYLQGMRQFDIIDLAKGQLEVSYEEEDGQLHLRWEEVLTKRETEIGRLARLDTSPLVKKREHSLESLRAASLGQVILDQQESLIDAGRRSLQFISGLIDYGTYGIASWRDDSQPDNPLAHVRELIPPWELLSTPSDYNNPTDLRAVTRSRLFPVVQLSKMDGVTMPSEDKDLQIVELPYGANTYRQAAGGGLGAGAGTVEDLFDEEPSGRTSPRGAGLRRELMKPLRTTEKFVRLREMFTLGPDGETVARYIARAGRAIVKDIDYLNDGIRVPFPIGIAHFHDINRFYGRSFTGTVIPMALELENLLEALIQDAADLRRLGFIFVPFGRGIDFERFKAADDPVVIGYDEDFAAPRSPIDSVNPAVPSEIPGRTMQFGLGLLDRSTAQGPMLSGQAPGRAESGTGFNVLAEMGATHLIPVARRISSAFAAMWRSQLFTVRQNFTSETQMAKGLPLTRIENSIAGVVIDPETGRLRIKPDQLPDPFAVDIGIRSDDPTRKERRSEQALSLALSELRMPTPLELIIMNYKEGWDLPLGSKAVWENYIKAVLYNLIMFGDGETPGDLPGADPSTGSMGVYFNPAVDKAEVHLLAIEEFTSGAEFSLAGVDVQNAFRLRVRELKTRINELLPEQLPPREEAAAMSAAQQQQQQQGPGPPQGART